MASFHWTHLDVERALGLSDVLARPGTAFGGVSTDTRTLHEGDVFVALVGERFDGHDFMEEAVAAGAGGLVVSRAVEPADQLPIYVVRDTVVALGALATYRRRAHEGRVIAVTGSSGKTTTKDLMRAALQGAYRVHATSGNNNNRIGLPLTILQAPDSSDVLVVEMGSNEPGEIRTLTEIAEPDLGVVTTVSDAHLEKLSSLEGVFAEKLALLEGLRSDGWAVVGDEPATLPERARVLHPGVRVTGWSDLADPDLRPDGLVPDSSGCFRFTWRDQEVRLRIPGRHLVQNALFALAVADHLAVPPAVAVRGVGSVKATGMRGEQRQVGDLTLLVDCYNANPQSVRAALDLLELIPTGGRRVAVLGTMLELGERSTALHEDVLRDALSRPVNMILALGEFARIAERSRSMRGPVGPELLASTDLAEGYALLRERLDGDELVLLKGSRGVALERLLPLLEADFGVGAPVLSKNGEG